MWEAAGIFPLVVPGVGVRYTHSRGDEVAEAIISGEISFEEARNEAAGREQQARSIEAHFRGVER